MSLSERAPQLLFDDGLRVIPPTASVAVAVVEVVSARGSIPIPKYYELDRLASQVWQIVQQRRTGNSDGDHWAARVALQFPDELLCDAPEVCWAMEDALDRLAPGTASALVFCLGDTTFGACCPDEVAALHLYADVLVHYGHACLSQPARSLPVLYGFGVTEHWNASACVDAILGQCQTGEQPSTQRILLLYQVQYQHAMEDLQTQLSERGDILVVMGQIQQEPLEHLLLSGQEEIKGKTCCQGTKDCDSNNPHLEPQQQQTKDEVNETKDSENSTRNDASLEQPALSKSDTFLLGGLEIPRNLDFASFVLVYIGDDPADGQGQGEGQRQFMNTILWYCSAKSRPAALWTYSPRAQTLCTSTPPGIQRQLNRRFFMIQKARDASIFGILIGTLSQRHFRTVVDTLRRVIEMAGRSSYTFAMGKVNPAKIANFAEIQCFVMVACAETSWLDDAEQRDMHVPIITPLELHMALGKGGPEVQWGQCDYSLDYQDFLALHRQGDGSNSDEQPSGANGVSGDGDDDAPYFSMITGKYETSSKRSIPKETVDLTALPGKGQLTTYTSEAAEFLRNREYKGLETKIGEIEVHAAVPGQRGIASKYNNDCY